MPKKLEKIEQESSSYTHMGHSSKQINKCKQYVTIYFKGEGTEYIYISIAQRCTKYLWKDSQEIWMPPVAYKEGK